MNNQERYEQHKRDGGTLTFEQFVARKPKKRKKRRKRYGYELADLANDIYGDLPDGAFFAACEDTFGLEPEDFF